MNPFDSAKNALLKIEEVKYTLRNLNNRKMRSLLTMLSILIGITAIFALISFGIGIQYYVNTLAGDAGVDKLFIQAKGIGAPGTDSTFSLTQDDIDFVSKINNVKEIAGIYIKPVEVRHDKEIKYTTMMGIDMDQWTFVASSSSLKIIQGRDLKTGDLDKVALGYSFSQPNKFFKSALRVGDKITLNGNLVEVVGFYKGLGNPSDDSQIYVTAAEIESITDTKGKYAFALIQAEKGVNPTTLADSIKEKLRKHKGQEKGKEDFYVMTYASALEIFTSVINVLNGVLVLIAIISVVVAAVNIMNTMYTSVLERTKEIGVMKAIGARNEDILFIFILEAGVVGLVGGLMGVMLGYIIASIGGGIAASAGYALLQPVFPWYLIVGCLIFATLVGAGSGLLPAIRASRQKPVDSLRYE